MNIIVQVNIFKMRKLGKGSRLKFEVAKLALEAVLNNEQTDWLIKIYQQCTIRKQKSMFLNHQDIHNKWAAASHCITKFTKEVISVPYNGKWWDFNVHYWNLWDLTTDLLGDCNLFPHFMFDAQRLSKFDGETFIHFVDKLFTAQDFWDIQSRLPPGGKLLAFILYADKTKLSSFGTAKGCPVVKEDKDYAGKSSWVNFKNTVWHSLFARIISLCVVSLIHRIMSLWPCPVCLVPCDELWDTSKSYPHRTSDESQVIVATAQGKDTMEEKDENSLWAIQYTNVHQALSHDHMHNGRLWSHHLWVELQKYVVSLRRSKVSAINKMYQNFKHPNQVMGVSFADSSMHEDISKKTPHSATCYFDVYAFILKLMYTLLSRFTQQTLFMKGEQYIMEAGEENDKGWSFPKMHLIMHIFDDIEAKGTTRNYNTKPNEQMHRPLKKLYQCWTNFKDFAKQILQINHWLLVSDDICRRVEDLDNFSRSTSQAGNIDADVDDPATDDPVPLDGFMHVKIGSMQASLTLEQIEMAHWGVDVAFTSFCVKLNAFLNIFLLACNLPLPNGKRVQLLPSNTADANQVTECLFLQVNYESLVDWQQHTDYLRCSPMFFNAPRFDCVFIQTEQKVILGCLIFLFQCPVGKDVFPLTLIHPFDAPTARPCAQAEFFSVRSIICGAFLVPDSNLNCLVINTVNIDIFLHVKEIHLEAGHLVRI
ncbi:hypothetical protein BDR06DRAFT_979328 [Suillus hirtellus]|nr:hypothetical protein BDR06DRAFT_979328 [Suillus hirtellus]